MPKKSKKKTFVNDRDNINSKISKKYETFCPFKKAP